MVHSSATDPREVYELYGKDAVDRGWRYVASAALLHARDVMTRDPVAVYPTSTLKALVDILLEGAIDSAPVVDRSGRLVGVAMLSDVLEHLAHGSIRTGVGRQPIHLRERPLAHEPQLRGIRFSHVSFDDVTVSEILHADPVAVQPGTSLSRVTELLLETGSPQLFVVDGAHLVGVITRLDVMRRLTHPGGLGPRSALSRTARVDHGSATPSVDPEE